jgi:AcrR family transcriptional regulator
LADRRGRLAAGDRRSQILAAALEVFAERGFHGARTRELAKRAGVSEALVFSHFPTKEALIRAIFDYVGFEERIRVMEERFSRMPPRQALLSLAEHVLDNLRQQPEIFRVIFHGILETPELAGHFYERFLSRLLALETELFRKAFAARGPASAGESNDPAIVARSFHGSLLFYNLAGAIVRIEPLPENPGALATAIVNIYLPEASS